MIAIDRIDTISKLMDTNFMVSMMTPRGRVTLERQDIVVGGNDMLIEYVLCSPDGKSKRYGPKGKKDACLMFLGLCDDYLNEEAAPQSESGNSDAN